MPLQMRGSDCMWPATLQSAVKGAAVSGDMACNQKPSATSA